MSFLADALLAGVERDRSAPHYGEEVFRRKLLEANKREKRSTNTIVQQRTTYLSQSEWADVISDADLTERQLDVLMQRFRGMTFEEIGNAAGHSKQGAQNIFFQGAKKLARAWVNYRYRGLQEVYDSEIRRTRLTGVRMG